MRSASNSTAIDVVRTWAIVLVVFLHARTGMSFTHPSFAIFSDFISSDVAALAVPLFFIFSGFLANWKQPSHFDKSEAARFLIRLIDLGACYIFWNVFLAAIALLAAKANLHIGDFSASKLEGGLLAVLGLDSQFPIAYQFWFIRELILISLSFFLLSCVFSPLRLFCHFAILAISVSWFFLDARSAISITAYGVGVIAGKFHARDIYRNIQQKNILMWASIGISLLLCVILLTGSRSVVVRYTFLVSGCLAVILGALKIRWSGSSTSFYRKVAGASFFLFAAHEPLLSLLKRFFSARFSAEVAYISAPVLIIVVLMGFQLILPSRL